MTCEDFRNLVGTKSPLDATNAELGFVASHGRSCKACCDWTINRAEEASKKMEIEDPEKLAKYKTIAKTVSVMLALKVAADPESGHPDQNPDASA